tara:strand:- start:1899 stop:2417 length:519 start_codon:yes stop_codon:yes gene_type:complete
MYMPQVKSGFRKRRVPRPKKLIKPDGNKYDSIWEAVLHESILKDWEHHVDKVPYVIEHKYEPDFVREVDGCKILLESKGRFWDFQEYNKYIWVRKQLPEDTELVFLFANPDAPMPAAKRRKDGTKRSHGEWAWANNFRWYSEDTIPDHWIDAKARESDEYKKRNDKLKVKMQ